MRVRDILALAAVVAVGGTVILGWPSAGGPPAAHPVGAVSAASLLAMAVALWALTTEGR